MLVLFRDKGEGYFCSETKGKVSFVQRLRGRLVLSRE